jgi:hypothetical protein
MEQKPKDKEQVSALGLMMANSIQVDALTHLLIEKGLITEEDFYRKLKQVQRQYNQPHETRT